MSAWASASSTYIRSTGTVSHAANAITSLLATGSGARAIAMTAARYAASANDHQPRTNGAATAVAATSTSRRHAGGAHAATTAAATTIA